MAALILLLALVTLAVLARRYGADSRSALGDPSRGVANASDTWVFQSRA
jgi:hypothetical protein